MGKAGRLLLPALLVTAILFAGMPSPASAKEFVGNVVIENGQFSGIADPLIGPGRLTYTIYTKYYESIDILVMDEENAEKYILGQPCSIVEGASVTGTWNGTVQGVNLGTGGYVIVFDNTDAFAAQPSDNIGSKNVTVYYRIEYSGIQESSGFFKDINLWTNANIQCIAVGVIVLVILIGIFAGKKRSSGGYYLPPEETHQPTKKVTVTRRYYKMPPQEGYPPQHGYPPQQGSPPRQRQRRPPSQPPY